MLSILYSDFEQFGCPNCGCDAARGSCVSGGGLSSATCRHCGLHFEVRGSTVYSTCEYAAYPEDPENPRSEYVMEQAIRIPHPRIGIPSWHSEDLRPGDVVQRYKDIIIPIGKPMGRAYTTLLAAPISAVCFSNKVKILSKGTLIKL